MQKCPLCQVHEPRVARVDGRDIVWVECPACGRYKITPEADGWVRQDEWADRRYLLSAATRRASESKDFVELLTDSMEELVASIAPPSTPLDVLDELLLTVHSRTQSLVGGAWIPFTDYPLFVLRSHNELREFCQQLGSLQYAKVTETEGRISCTLTLEGWKRVGELRKTGRSSRQAFVAMSFAQELEAAWADGLRPGIEDAGFVAVRVDKVEHNEKICDRIIAEIRRSGFVVADFTGNRAGVYFEAGFAAGLGLPVIYCVRSDQIDRVHFDTRQYNHISWTDASDLRVKLHDRIAATIGASGAA